MAQRCGRRAGKAHSAAKIQNVKWVCNWILPEPMGKSERAIPQFRPVRQMEIVPRFAHAAQLLAAVRFLGNFVQYAIGIGHARELKLQWADVMLLGDDCESLANAMD